MKRKPKRKKRNLILLPAIVAVLCAAYLIFPSGTSTTVMKGHSMEPAIRDGQVLTIDLNYYNRNPIRRGDIIQYKLMSVSEPLIGRVIALPGDGVEINDGRIAINGTPLTGYNLTEGEARIISKPLDAYGGVPPGSILVLTDNHASGADSGRFGFIPTEYVKGKALLNG